MCIRDSNGSVGDKYKELFNVASSYMNVSEDQLVFYTDLYSHVYASLREVLREKMASLFRSHVKSDVLRQTSAKQLTGKPDGLFAGVCLNVSGCQVVPYFLWKTVLQHKVCRIIFVYPIQRIFRHLLVLYLTPGVD